MNTQLQTLKGFRDFLPQEKRERDYVAQKVKETFSLFGFQPLETPTLEYASLLLGKYGDEADKLVYTFEDNGKRKVALRYDQTVPTARVLAQYQQQVSKYFRRYQIQNVFRADKPQKGRFREFAQCDIDIFATVSPIADAEILACSYAAFKNVGFQNVVLRINDRNLLFEKLEPFSSQELPVLSLIQTIDKLDKIEEVGVVGELVEKGLTQEQAKKALSTLLESKASDMLETIISYAVDLGIPKENIEFMPTLARGLDYYTGMIFEISVPSYGKSSLGGGGRYDNLINQLGGPKIPAVGVAFGFDRMVEAAQELGILPNMSSGTQVLVSVFNQDCLTTSLRTAQILREKGIATEIYPSSKDSLGNQLKYASKANISYVVIIGDEEKEKNVVTIKEMDSGKQFTISLNTLENSSGDLSSLLQE